MFLLLGIAFAWGATAYNVGSGARMGPGYFPLVLGVVLAVLGALILIPTVKIEGFVLPVAWRIVHVVLSRLFPPTESDDDAKIGSFAWKPLICIIGANVAFGICLGGLKIAGITVIPSLGLIIGIFTLVLIASLAAEQYKLPEVLGLATVLAAGCWLTFVVLLKLQIPVWPSFLG